MFSFQPTMLLARFGWRVWLCAVVMVVAASANAANAVENKPKPRTSSLFALPKQALETAKASDVDEDTDGAAEGANREKKRESDCAQMSLATNRESTNFETESCLLNDRD
jgi:hypothetical protein